MKAKSGKAAEARNELEGALLSARQFGYRLYEYQLRLALGEIGMASDVIAARRALAALEKDAAAHGAMLVSNQARLLRNAPPAPISN